VNRGDVYDIEFPGGGHPGVIVTRDRAIPLLRNVCVVQITGTVRDLPTEVPLGPLHGLKRPSVANCDNLLTVPKAAVGRRRGTLGPEELSRLNAALRIALDLN
jgi:mRNA interferase MazF